MNRFVCFRSRNPDPPAPDSGWRMHPYAQVYHYWDEGQTRSLCTKWWYMASVRKQSGPNIKQCRACTRILEARNAQSD